MGNFEVIASMGHCGTMWLSRVLDAGTDTKWYHELRLQMCGSWVEALEHDPFDDYFNPYWERVTCDLEAGNVGDANSWWPTRLPWVGVNVDIFRIIYLRRNPIQQLHSLTTKSYVWRKPPPLPRVVLGHLFMLYHFMDKQIESPWEALCLLVAANDFLPDWLRSHGLPVEVYDLETLTTDVDALLQLAPNLTRDEAKAWQKRDINRKVYGPRTPEAIWEKWTQEQRDGFERVVGVPKEIQCRKTP